VPARDQPSDFRELPALTRADPEGARTEQFRGRLLVLRAGELELDMESPAEPGHVKDRSGERVAVAVFIRIWIACPRDERPGPRPERLVLRGHPPLAFVQDALTRGRRRLVQGIPALLRGGVNDAEGRRLDQIGDGAILGTLELQVYLSSTPAGGGLGDVDARGRPEVGESVSVGVVRHLGRARHGYGSPVRPRRVVILGEHEVTGPGRSPTIRRAEGGPAMRSA